MLRVFQQLREEDELTTRVYARPTLDKWEALAEVGIEHGFGDDWLRIGGLKGFVDGIMATRPPGSMSHTALPESAASGAR